MVPNGVWYDEKPQQTNSFVIIGGIAFFNVSRPENPRYTVEAPLKRDNSLSADWYTYIYYNG